MELLQAIKYNPSTGLEVLDQLRLPYETHYERVVTCEQAWDCIRSMRVRGAPAIAIVAALALASEIKLSPTAIKDQDAEHFISKKLDYLVTARPTAVNLADAAQKLKRIVHHAAIAPETSKIADTYCKAAEDMLERDVADNEAIGHNGAEWILERHQAASTEAVSILTHCNTGSLATAGYGTALGVVRAVHGRGTLKRAFCTETRPYNQGSRLTAFELIHDEMPGTLITDSMAASLLQLKKEEENIAAVVVGADRVAANGDTANKIGTYALAILARHHGVRFLVAAPRTTIDMGTPTGASIKIEERPGKEMTVIKGPVFSNRGVDLSIPPPTVSIAAEGIEVWNPAFDVTPHELIDGIITEVGVIEKNSSGAFPLQQIMR